MIQVYQARSINDELSESSYIGMALFGWFQALVIGIPVAFLVGENTTASFFVKAGLIFLVSMSILLLMFVPKILKARQSDGGITLASSSFSRASGNQWGADSSQMSSEFGLRFTNTASSAVTVNETALLKRLGTVEEENDKLRVETEQLKQLLKTSAIEDDPETAPDILSSQPEE